MIEPRSVANLKGIATIFLWSLSALFISWTPEIPPFLLAACTSAFGFVLFAFRWMKSREKFDTAIRQPVQVWILFAVAVIAYRGFYLSGLKIAPTVEANLLNYLWPLLIVVFGAFVNRKMPTPTVLCGAVAGLCGVGLLLTPSGIAASSLNITSGHILAFLGAVCWSGYSVATRLMKADSSDLIGVMHGVAVLIFIAFHVAFEPSVAWERVDMYHVAGVTELGLAISLGYSWWDEAMSRGDQHQIAIGANFIPLLSTIWLVLFGSQAITQRVICAAGLIIVGSYIAKRSSQ